MASSQPAKVLWISDSPLIGTGFGRVSKEILSRLKQCSHLELACIGWGHDGWPYDTNIFPVTIFPSPDGSHASGNFERVLTEFKPDVVITLGEIWMLDWLFKHPSRSQFKWIAYLPIDSGPFYPPWESLLKNVDAIVAMSEFGRQVLQSGLPSRHIEMIYHGVNTTAFRPLPEREYLKSHERFKNKFVVGCVARNQSRKNIPALVKAFAQVSKKIGNLHLYLHMNPCDVGFDIVTLLQRYQLYGKADVSSPNSNLQKPLTDHQLNRLYNIFDVTVLPSTAEGFGLPIIESMAAGIPVIATNYSACAELVKNRGELINILSTVTMGTNLLEQAVIDVDHLASCIETLYVNRALIDEYSRRSRAFAESLNWDSLIPKWQEIILKVAGKTEVRNPVMDFKNSDATTSLSV